VPPARNERFEEVIENLIKSEGIEYYAPLIDEEIPKAHAIASRINQMKLISPTSRFVELCLDKYLLMQELSGQDISYVRTFLGNDSRDDMGYPIFVKPRIGRGSRGIRKIESADQFNAYFKLNNYDKEDVIVQKYYAGAEYSVSVTVNNLNKLISVVPKKIILKKGITIHAVTETSASIADVCGDIVNKLKPSGPFNVQLIVVDGNIKIFEINPRFSTTSILSCEAGVNEFELCIESYNNEDVSKIESFREGVYLYRRWESCFYED
jgi:carbamoyl-phosphate synthase large subunit